MTTVTNEIKKLINKLKLENVISKRIIDRNIVLLYVFSMLAIVFGFLGVMDIYAKFSHISYLVSIIIVYVWYFFFVNKLK